MKVTEKETLAVRSPTAGYYATRKLGNPKPPALRSLIPVAEYVRMSTELQPYSIANQSAAIREYAGRHGLKVVRTYSDGGRSGLVLKNRDGLGSLLRDVMAGHTEYKAILVYDVSRWGRFQDADEAAHYEFICRSNGVPIHYCAEAFTNDGTVSSSIMKAIKRTMAAEFSRELGVKSFDGQKRLVQLGFRTGGRAGYGLQRMMVSADGKRKQKLAMGEYKNLKTDRVVLIRGDSKEIKLVRHIHAIALKTRAGCTDIARDLNRRGLTCKGRPWTYFSVHRVLSDRKYTGWNVWGRTSQRLHGPVRRVAPQDWVLARTAFAEIIHQRDFDRVQAILQRKSERRWSDEELVGKLKRLLALKGVLTVENIDNCQWMPTTGTYIRRFGSMRQAYKLIGYRFRDGIFVKSDHATCSRLVREQLITEIKTLFPQNVTSFCLPGKHRSLLRLDHSIPVSVIACRKSRTANGHPRWMFVPEPAECGYTTLICCASFERDEFEGLYLFPRMDLHSWHLFAENDQWLAQGVRLIDLSLFYKTAKSLQGSVLQ